MKRVNHMKNLPLGLLLAFILSACSTMPDEKMTTGKSYLQQNKAQQAKRNAINEFNGRGNLTSAPEKTRGITYLPSLVTKKNSKNQTIDLTQKFSDSKVVKLTAEDLPLKDYLHYVLGDLLTVSYILDNKVKNDKQTVTLNLQEEISQRKLFTISEGLLTERGYVIQYDDGIYYIHSTEGTAKGDIVYGYGNTIDKVPNTSLDIMQMVPFNYGLQTQLSLVLTSIAKVKVIPAAAQNAFLIRGKRQEIIKALEFIELMDQPAYSNRQIGLYKTTFVSTDEITKKLSLLLKQEGLSVAADNQVNKAVSIISLDRTGTLVFFAPTEKVLQRVNFWLQQIDQPLSGGVLQYFLYSPTFSRATDLGESLTALIGGNAQSSHISDSISAAGQNKNSNTNNKQTITASSDKLKIVVDQRANALIFHTTGEQYRQLVPLIKQLDVMPKQIVLEVMIAEVTLTDEFKQGVEFAFANGNYGLSNVGAFMGDGFGGLSYLLQGNDGQIALNLLQTNSLVNIVSRPSLVVRDGVNANITVGTDIPIVGETSSDPLAGGTNKQTTKIEYRKTGVQLDVLPTINAQGVIIMEIKQKISNQVEAGSTVANNPSIFERSITTEVVARSGQTIMLGGLISENRSNKETKVPFFADLPLIGGLFKAETESGDKTELVILVTPRVVESVDEWNQVKASFSLGLTELILED